MAARNRTWTPEKVRQRIRTSMLVNRIEKHALDELETDMSATQLEAAKYLVDKLMPKATEAVDHKHSGKVEVTLKFG